MNINTTVEVLAGTPENHTELERLRTENEFLRAQVAHVGLWDWDWDLINDRVDYSDKWKRQLGMEPDEGGDTAHEWEQRLHPIDREHVIETVRLCTITPKYRFDLTVRMRHKGGHWIWINSRGFNVSTDEGVIVRMLGTHINVTGYKKLERKLLKAEAKQRMARELAERENLAKSSFLAAVSHEIRTPLNGILGVLQMLRISRNLDSETLEKLVEMGESSGKRILRVIGESLDIARIETGKLELIQEAVDLVSLLDELKSNKSERASSQGLELKWRVADDVPRHILIDAVRLRQVLANLLVNAFKFTRAGFVSLEASVVKRPKDKAVNIRFVVSDSGVGFSKEFGRIIFEPFTQGEERSQSSDHGIGMGLAITRELVGLMGGRIEVSSRRGVGSHFAVTLPVRNLAETSDVSGGEPPRAVPSLRGKILVVDDDWISAEVARLMLLEMGFQVDLAVDGGQGLAMASSTFYDLILMDCWMPVMSGTEATRALRSSASGLSRDVPIIAVTANAGESDAAECRDAGMNDFIVKPLLLEKLIEKLAMHLPVDSSCRASSVA